MLTQAALLVAIATSAYASPLVVRQEPLKDCGGIAYPPSKVRLLTEREEATMDRLDVDVVSCSITASR